MPFFKWSKTAASNGTADATCPFPEGMAPSSVNDGIRGAMAALAMYRDDIAGAIVTAGTSAAYTVSSYSGFDSTTHMDGQVVAFSPHTGNVDTVTLNVDSLGAFPLRYSPGVELVAGTLITGTPYAALFNKTAGEFYLKGAGSGNPYNVPFLGGMDFWDTVAPNSRFIFPTGQAISRTVYSAAFARWGTTFGAGDGSTTFNVPDKTGRVSAMIEGGQNRLPQIWFGGISTSLGAVGGAADHLLTANEIPAVGFSGTTGGVSQFHTHTYTAPANPVGLQGGSTFPSANIGTASLSTGADSVNHTHTFSGAINGGGAAHAIVPPTIICNYIIRII